ncbi:MAG: NUDIX domain-containing protein [Pirellulales bacterium]|nr:NUDIX domain-containing protein [Pirellulales bacterium]
MDLSPAPPPPIVRRGAVAVIWRDSQLLVIRRSHLVAAPGKYCFPGGGIEPGESEPMAVIRELREELNAIVLPQRCVWKNVTRWGVELAWWLSTLENPDELAPNPDEVASIHWVTPAEMRRLRPMLDSNREFLELAERGEISIR